MKCEKGWRNMLGNANEKIEYSAAFKCSRAIAIWKKKKKTSTTTIHRTEHAEHGEWMNESINKCTCAFKYYMSCVQKHGGAIGRPTDRQTEPIGCSWRAHARTRSMCRLFCWFRAVNKSTYALQPPSKQWWSLEPMHGAIPIRSNRVPLIEGIFVTENRADS